MKIKYAVLLLVIVISTLSIIGCSGGESAVAEDGDRVFVHYTGTLKDGSKFDSSLDRGEPLEFVIGAHQMIPGFENAVRGMKVGESKTVTLAPSEAYGEYRDELLITISSDELPEGAEIQVGQQLPLKANTGATIQATVIEVKDDSIIFDANHFLAGKDLIFEIELVKVEAAE